jgi:DNA-binding transcriptional LysR family regulator
VSKDQVRRYKELHLGQLRAFCECVRYKSFSAAARALSISHASVWQKVRALERDYGVSLLQRRGREMWPTDDGLLLLEMASSVVNSVDSLRAAFEQRRGKIPRSLIIVATPGAIVAELAQPVVAFRQRHDDIQIRLVLSASTAQMLDLLASGDADLGIWPSDMAAVTASKRIVELEPLCERPAALVVPENHPLASRRRLALTDIVRYPIILPDAGGSWRTCVDDVLRAAGLLDRLRILLENNITLATLRFVSFGLGPALLPLPRNVASLPGIKVHLVEGLFPPEQLTIVRRRGATPRPQARLFTELLTKELGQSLK